MRVDVGLLIVTVVSSACGASDPELEPACAAADVARCGATQMACAMVAGAAECQKCGVGQHADGTGQCAVIQGLARAHDFPMQTVAAGGESLGMCRSWTLGNDEDLWVVGVELTQDEQSHHSNWTFAPDTRFPGPDGIWKCSDRGYDQLSAAVAGGVIYAQSTQAAHETQVFPEGAAVRIPAHSTIFSDIHLLNATDKAWTGHASLSLYGIPRSEVRIPLAPFHLTYHALALPPLQSSRVSMTCEIANGYLGAAGTPLDVRLFYALPHTHGLGVRVFLDAVGGPLDGHSLLDVVGSPGEARGVAYQPPIDLSGTTSLRFGCEFDNPRNESVHWGFGDQEMCEMLGFIESKAVFEGSATTQIGMGTDGVLATFEGNCGMLWLNWAEH